MGAIIESIRSLVESKNIKSLEGMRSDIKNALEIMCTSSAMDAMNPPVRFELPEDMSFWPDIVAMRKTASGQPVLTIETDSYGKIAKNGDGTFKITKNGEPKVNPDGSYEYITKMVEGKMQYESFIAYEDRAWDKIGFDSQPFEIGDNVQYIANSYIESWKNNGFASATATANGQFDQIFKDSCLFFPDLLRIKEDYPKVDTSRITNWSSAFANSSIINMPSKLDTSGATNLSGLFKDCVSLSVTPEIDATSCSSLQNMFSGMTNLKEVGKIKYNQDTVYNLNSMFNGVNSIQIDTTQIFDGLVKVSSLYEFCGASVGTINISNLVLTDNCNLFHFLYYKQGVSTLTMYNLPNLTTIDNNVAIGNGVKKLTIVGENTDDFTSVLPSQLYAFIKIKASNCDIYVTPSVYKDLEDDDEFFENVMKEGSTYYSKNIKVHRLWQI